MKIVWKFNTLNIDFIKIEDKGWWRCVNTFSIIIAELIFCCLLHWWQSDATQTFFFFFKCSIQHDVNGNSEHRAVPSKSLSGVFFPQFRFAIATNAISEALQPKQQRWYRCQLFYLRAPIFSNGSICFCGILEMISSAQLNDVTNSHDCR